MNLRVNHEEINNFYDLSKNESEFIREKIDFWIKKIDELKEIWQGEDADTFYDNATSYLKNMYILPEFYDSIDDFIINANRQYRNTDLLSKKEFQKITDLEEYDV